MTPEVSPNLMRSAKIALLSASGRFCANFLNLSNFLLYVKLLFQAAPSRPTTRLALIPQSRNPNRKTSKSCRFSSFAQRKTFKQRPASLKPLGLAGLLPGLAMACSLKDSLQGSRGYRSDLTRPYEPASHFPFRAGPTATGRLHR